MKMDGKSKNTGCCVQISSLVCGNTKSPSDPTICVSFSIA